MLINQTHEDNKPAKSRESVILNVLRGMPMYKGMVEFVESAADKGIIEGIEAKK